MRIINTPWKNLLLEQVANSSHSIKVTSPFIKANICDEILRQKKAKVKLDVITSYKLMSIYSGSLDIVGLEKIISHNGNVRNYPKLHSKIYLFDDKRAIVTSGNLTNGGLLNNYEYGVYFEEVDAVAQVKNDFEELYNNEKTGLINQEKIDIVKDILSKIPETVSLKIPRIDFETPEEKLDIIEIPEDIISSSLNGWNLEVFKCINQIHGQEFSLKQINQYESHLREIYPLNNHILDKIRQQLQILRDFGLIEFGGDGHYKKLWR